MRRKLFLAGVALIVAGAACAWFGREPLQVRYHVGRLESGDEAAIERVAQLGEPAVPRLLELMSQDTPAAARAAQALTRMLEAWPADDPRTARVGGQLTDAFPGFTPPVRQATLRLAEALRGSAVSARIVQAALRDNDPATREQALLLALRPEIGQGAAVVALLKDPQVDVRRGALEAVGPSRDLIADEDLLPLLHDPDPDMRGLCEAALRGRGLRDKDIQLGRLVTDPSPLKRLEVLRHLPGDADLDPEVWLQKLCQDPSPAVRAGAARAALDPASGLDAHLAERVRQMAQSDPDGTVRQIADFLLRNRPAPNR